MYDPMKKMNEDMQRILDPMYDINKTLNPMMSITERATDALNSMQYVLDPMKEFNDRMEAISNPFSEYEKMMEYTLDPMKKINEQMEVILNPFPNIGKKISSFESISSRYAQQIADATSSAAYLQKSIDSLSGISSLQRQAELFATSMESYRKVEEALSAQVIQKIVPAQLNTVLSDIMEKEAIYRQTMSSVSIASDNDEAMLLQELQNIKDEITHSLDTHAANIEIQLEDIYSRISAMNNPLLLAFFVSFIFPIIMNIMSSAIYDFKIKPELTSLTSPKQQQAVIKKEVTKNIKLFLSDKEQKARYRIVSADVLNIRSSKSTKSRLIAFTFFGEVVEIVRKEKNWCLIKRYDKENETYIQGWAFTRYLAQIR